MAKSKTTFVCQNCGASTPKWMGKCPSCEQWNTLTEELAVSHRSAKEAMFSTRQHNPVPTRISDIEYTGSRRLILNDRELNRVLGGGLVPGSLVLFGGEPGIGKSTLLLQVALQTLGLKVLYVSGEESAEQIKMRAERIGIENEQCFILTETNTRLIFNRVKEVQPDMLIIDSIQTLYSDAIESTAGTVSQLRECAAEIMRYAKDSGVPVFLIGHITKEGAIAGPKILEHMVDAVVQFEGDRKHIFRLLRTTKNRFGSTNELGIYEMRSAGLATVENPSQILINQGGDQLSGVAVAATLEGMRPLLVEVQALVSSAVYGTPQRTATGFDTKRLNMLLAVLEKRCGFKLGAKDVFLNIAGGIRVDDPAIDLAVVSAILSSNTDLPVLQNICFAAEIGLSGEIRPVARTDQRITEAEKLGFEKIIISRFTRGIPTGTKVEIIKVGKIEEVLRELFG